MGKTYEALERAEKEYQKNFLGASRKTPRAPETSSPKLATSERVLERYEDLKTNFLTRYPDGSIKTVLFMATESGVGCSTTALNFATSLAKEAHFRVLLVEVNLRTPSLCELFKIDYAEGLSELLTGNTNMVTQIKRVGPGNLYVLACGKNHSAPTSLFVSSRFDQFLELIRNKFDYIVFDGPPAPLFAECRMICHKVDGVILVLESGKTRRQVALNVKKQLEDAKGKLLGVVLNKRRHYIPDWIYRRL
jgi:capsular exopolysaccharide synthesis family protein